MSVKFTLRFLLILTFGLFFNKNNAQTESDLGNIHGNFQIDAANYQKDTIIGADPGSEVFRYNAFGNINYTKGGFSAGVRFESYNPPLIGYLPGYKGSGVPYRFARYQHKDIDITVGNFYEQFGSGLLYRGWEDRALGINNALRGGRVIFKPTSYFTLKGIFSNSWKFKSKKKKLKKM